jgi:hypothetical protein
MRPIDGDALIVAIERMMKHQIDADDICEMIQNFPTIEPEREKGKWIKLYRGTIAEGLHCSVCGKHGYRSDFCPNCGADMRGGEDEA